MNGPKASHIFRGYQPAFGLNGSTQYYQIQLAAAAAAPLTMACWFNSTSVTATQGLITINRADATGGSFGLEAAGAVAGDPVRVFTTSPVAATTTSYLANRWHHAAGVIASASSRSAYLDGGGKATNTTASTPASLARTTVGAYNSSAVSNRFSGRIMWPFVWNVALSDAQIYKLSRGYEPWRMEPRYIVAGPDSQRLYDPYLRSTWTNTGAALPAEPLKFASRTAGSLALRRAAQWATAPAASGAKVPWHLLMRRAC